jgi:outer membrane protein
VNKFLNIVLAAAIATFALTANAQQGKIAVLNAQNAVMATELAKQRIKALQEDKDFMANKTEAEKVTADLQKGIETYKKEAAVMNASQKAEQEKKLANLQADREHLIKKLKAAENDVLQRLMIEMQPKLQQVVTELIQSEGIGMIINAQAVMHADTSFNITGKVTEKRNQAK